MAYARRSAFLETPNRRTIALIGIFSARRNRRISAQSSTLITLHRVTEGVRFHPSIRGQFSPVADTVSDEIDRLARVTPREPVKGTMLPWHLVANPG